MPTLSATDRAFAARARAERSIAFKDYLSEKFESRACGTLDFMSFEEWMGEVTPREVAEITVALELDAS